MDLAWREPITSDGNVLDDFVWSARKQSSTRQRRGGAHDARLARCHGWERSPWTFLVVMVSKSFQELDNKCVHESSTMPSKRRSDRSDCTGLVQRTGSPRVSRSTWRVDGVALKALMSVSWRLHTMLCLLCAR